MPPFDAERETSMPSFDEILKICNRYQSSNYYVDPGIPKKKLATARNSYHIPDAERVAALLIVGFGTGTDGLAVAENGLYWKSNIFSPTSMSWKELAEVLFVHKKGFITDEIVFSDRNAFKLNGNPTAKNIILLLLRELEKLAMEGGAGSDQWMVAVAGQQSGPYNVVTLRRLIRSRQIDPEVALVWCEKMDQWAALREVPEFRAAAPAKRPPRWWLRRLARLPHRRSRRRRPLARHRPSLPARPAHWST